jgi:signal transduction histidine kinase
VSFSIERFPRRLLALTTVPLLIVGAVLIAVTSAQWRAERRARRANTLDQTAARIASQVVAWGESVRVAALAADVETDPSRMDRLLSGLLERFPDIASVQWIDANGRRIAGQRRAGVLSLPDFSMESAGLRAHIQRVGLWFAPLHFQKEGSPRLPCVVALKGPASSRGFLIAEFQTDTIETLLRRAPLPMTLASQTGAVATSISRPIENLGLVLTLRDEPGFGAALVAGLFALLALLVAIAGFLERRWSRRAAGDIAHRERLMTIGATASAIGHELRTALAVIRKAIDALKLRADLSDPRAAKQIDAVENQVRLGNRLLSDLLEFARPRSPSLKPDDVNPLIEDVVGALGLPRAIRVETALAATLPPVALDADKMRQVLSNLILNASDAMPEGGTLKVATRRVGERVVVEIRDDGAGMALEVHRRLFEPFFSTKARGMGLGLSIVKKIVDAHGGDVQVESAPGRGTIVTFSLPAAPPSASQAAISEAASP